MAKKPGVNINFNAQAAASKLLKTFKKVQENDQMQKEIGETFVKRIQGAARSGKPLNNNGSFPELKETTKRIKELLKELNPVDKSYKKGKSNVTFTGQFLDAITFKVLRRGVQIFVEDSARFPVETLRGPEKETPNNADLDKDLRKRGFKVYTAQGIKKNDKLAKRLKSIVLRTLRRALGVSRELDKIK